MENDKANEKCPLCMGDGVFIELHAIEENKPLVPDYDEKVIDKK